ncbi:MAG TPA: DUF2239 family protein [Myxococcus sp.]|jgi:hypothetical protein|nr:DUF2239 family protein [Myxococcus sp.]
MPEEKKERSCVAFIGPKRVARGAVTDVALKLRELGASARQGEFLVFDEETSEPIDLDLRGSAADVVRRIDEAEAAKPGRGRPKLGVEAKEVTLLPRHWEWLAAQPGGASATLRRLVEDARKKSAGGEESRKAQDAAYRFMQALAGNLPGYEAALRALYARDRAEFTARVSKWPVDVREHLQALSKSVFSKSG